MTSSFNTIRLRWFALLAALLFVGAPSFAAADAANQSPAEMAADEAFLNGLRARRLFDLAAEHCRAELARTQPPERQANLIVELSRTLAEYALYARADDSERLWNEAAATLDRFIADHAQHPRIVLVRLQQAHVALARGELARQEAAVSPGADRLLAEARRMLLRGANLFEALDLDVQEELRRAGRANDESSERQFRSMVRTIAFARARAERNLALCYAADSSDRIDALSQALEHLRPLSESNVADSFAWEGRIDRIVCLRLLGKLDEAVGAIDAARAENPPEPIARRLDFERASLELARGRPEEALATLDQAAIGSAGDERRWAERLWAEADELRLEAMLSAWRTNRDEKNESAAETWRDRATRQVDLIAAKHGPYWGRRGRMQLAARIGQGVGADVATLVIAAESLLHAEKFAEAIAAYDRAAEQATTDGQFAEALRLSLVAAGVAQRNGDTAAALDRYRRSALAARDKPLARKAHLQAIWLAAQGESVDWDRYAALLEEHIATWSDGDSTAEARWQLGCFHQSRGAWSNAIETLLAIPSNHPHGAAGSARAAECFLRQLEALAAKQEATDVLARQSADRIEQRILGADGEWPAALIDSEREALLTAASIRLQFVADGANGAARSEAILARLEERSADAPKEFLAKVRAGRVAALAKLGRFQEAAQRLDELASDDAALWFELLQSTADAPAADVLARKERAEVTLRIVERLNQTADSSKDRKRTRRMRQAGALADLDRRDEALKIYRVLAKEFPDDRDVQTTLAEFLSASDDRDSNAAALEQWRVVAGKCRPASDDWLRAKLGLALAHERLGDKAQAARVVTLLAALHPELGGPALRGEFEALLERCNPRPK